MAASRINKPEALCVAIDFSTPRYHSDSSSTKALCLMREAPSIWLFGKDRVAPASNGATYWPHPPVHPAPYHHHHHHFLPLLFPPSHTQSARWEHLCCRYSFLWGREMRSQQMTVKTCIWIYNHSREQLRINITEEGGNTPSVKSDEV